MLVEAIWSGFECTIARWDGVWVFCNMFERTEQSRHVRIRRWAENLKESRIKLQAGQPAYLEPSPPPDRC